MWLAHHNLLHTFAQRLSENYNALDFQHLQPLPEHFVNTLLRVVLFEALDNTAQHFSTFHNAVYEVPAAWQRPMYTSVFLEYLTAERMQYLYDSLMAYVRNHKMSLR